MSNEVDPGAPARPGEQPPANQHSPEKVEGGKAPSNQEQARERLSTEANLANPENREAFIQQSATDLHDAINNEKWLGLKADPQEDRINAIVDPMSKDDRQALETEYQNKFDKDGKPGALRRDLENRLDDSEFRKVEASLNRDDGTANDAGQVKTLLTRMSDAGGSDKEATSDQLGQTLSTLNSQQLDKARNDYKQDYGKPLDEELQNTDDLSDATRKALPLLTKGSDDRTPQEQAQLANIAVDEKSDQLLGTALRGDDPKATETRNMLNNDPQFKKRMDEAFPDNQVARDYLEEGRISLSTVVDKNQSKFLGMGENKENVEMALKNVTPEERDRYKAGRALSDSHTPPQDPKARKDKEYFDNIHGQLAELGDDGETEKWDKLIAGDPQEKPEEEQVKPLSEVVNEKDADKIADGILKLNGDDRQRYQTDEKFRSEIDGKLEGVKDVGGVLVRHMMSEVRENGSLPELDKADQVLYDSTKQSPPGQMMQSIEAAVGDKDIRDRLLKNENLSDRDNALRDTIKDFIMPEDKKTERTTYSQADGPDEKTQIEKEQNDKLNEFIKNGRLPLTEQKELDVPLPHLYGQISKVSEGERKDFVDSLSDDEKAIAENAIKQDGNLSLADQLRSYSLDDGSDFKTFIDPLKELENNPQALTDLKGEYAKKYDSDLSDDVAGKLGDTDKQTLTDLLNPAGMPPREDYYDALDQSKNSGVNTDGTDVTKQRAIDEFGSSLQEYQSQFKDMPEEERKRLNQFFDDANEQYKESKEKFAKNVVNAVVVGGAIAAAPFTGGLSLGGVAAIATAGAAFRTGTMAAIQGDDFEATPGNILKESVLGAGQAGFTFLGPQAVAGATAIGKDAATHAASAVAKSEGKDLLQEGAEQGLRQELETAYMNSAIRGQTITNKDIDGIAGKFLRDGAGDAEKAQLSTILTDTSKREIATASEKHLLESLGQGAVAEGREAAFYSGASTAGNLGAALVAAPYAGFDQDTFTDSVTMGTVGGAVLGPAFKGAMHPLNQATERYLGEPAQRVTRKAVNEQLKSDDTAALLSRLQQGDRISFNDQPGWKVKGMDEEGNIHISHDAERQISVDQLRQMNAQEMGQGGPEPGKQYTIMDGQNPSEGWELDSLDMINGKINVVKKDADRQVVKRNQVINGDASVVLSSTR